MRSTNKKKLLLVGGASAALLLLLVLVSNEGQFLLRAGWQEARILLGRQPIDRMIADPATTPELRAQLEMVLAARAFAARRLGLAAGETYTTYSDVGEGPLLHVLSASHKDRLVTYQWRYPIVGAVPYKGFFEREDALAEQRRLEAAGYDTWLREASAFSTLGWFNDPLLSTALGDDADLVSTVIHEISHNTLWVPSEAHFNESYANFVGLRGAEIFFASRGEAEAAERCAAIWRDEKRLGTFYNKLSADLQDLYGRGLPASKLETRRKALFARARATLAGPLDRELEIYSGAAMSRRPLNNAVVLAQRIYRTGLDEFDRLYAFTGDDLRLSIVEIGHHVRRDRQQDPLTAVALAATTRLRGPRVPRAS